MYPVTTKTKTTTYLTIDKGENEVYEQDDKVVVALSKPQIAYPLNYHGKNSYAFGCSSGKFTYAELLLAIKGAQQSDSTGKTIQSIKKVGAKPSATYKTPIVDETANFYILENGKAYSTTEFEKVSVILPGSKDFGKFKYHKSEGWNEAQYYLNGYRTSLSTKKEILEQLLRTKAIIDFLEDKGDYAPIKNKVEEEVA